MPTNSPFLLQAVVMVSVTAFFFPLYGGLNHEGLALLSWLSTFNSTPSSSFFSSWHADDQDPCKWAFVTCSKLDGSVSEIRIKSVQLPPTFPSELLQLSSLTALVLSDVNITGEIPPAIADCTSLVLLDLSHNALGGSIPPAIGKLWQLRFLYLNSNSLQGAIPPQIGNLSELRELELVDNALTGRLPPELGNLTLVEIFRAGGNPGIYGEIPPEISRCQQLSFLGLADTSVSGQIPHPFGSLKNLRTLSVYTARLSGPMPPEIANCSALENLYLYQNRIPGELPAGIGQLKNLRRILLWRNELAGRIPESLGNCTNMAVVDLSLNSIVGGIPPSMSNLVSLEELLVSDNNISGEIPPFIGNFSRLKQLELDNNSFFGEIPPEIGNLKELTEFFAWHNQLQGAMPPDLGGCEKLQSLDLSYNLLTGTLPKSLFNIRSLNKVLLISNSFSGVIPPEISNCTSLIRLRLGSNRLSGKIPAEIGFLRGLSFLELSDNQLSGKIPYGIGNCTQLEMIDLHDNKLQGQIPTSSFRHLSSLNVLDLSRNRISGPLPEILGELGQLNKLDLSGNYITGLIPEFVGQCRSLQSLDLSSNRLTGPVPREIGALQGLDILLNLSWNYLSGPIPAELSNLSNLGSLDLSHNTLTGTLLVLGELDNLVSLDISYNNLSGYLPDTVFFRKLPARALSGNEGLCTGGINECFLPLHSDRRQQHRRKNTVLSVVFSMVLVAVFVTFGALFASWSRRMGGSGGGACEEQQEWEHTQFQKCSFSFDDVVTELLLESNVVGRGASGVVYRVETRSGQTIAVKKLWQDRKKNGQHLAGNTRDTFAVEVGILGSIRHKNIVRLLGYCVHRTASTRLLLFDYVRNGSLHALLHEKRAPMDWNARYKVLLGAAQGLAYLHHDCTPSIVHRDIKASNILVGPQFEAYLSDFGLAKLVDTSENSRASGIVAGSYGYIAPEYGYSLRITEKSDVYSYGVVALEVLTRLSPNDASIAGGAHIVEWVRRELQKPGGANAVAMLDGELLQEKQSESDKQEMLQALGVALLCVNRYPEDRPTMRDVAALLKEIKVECRDVPETERLLMAKGDKEEEEAGCSSFTRYSSETIAMEEIMSSSQ